MSSNTMLLLVLLSLHGFVAVCGASVLTDYVDRLTSLDERSSCVSQHDAVVLILHDQTHCTSTLRTTSCVT